MTRLLLMAVLLAGAAGLPAVVIADFQDDVELRSHETVRYRIDIEFGTATSVDIDIVVRGFWTPPRVRVLDARKKELKDVRDRDGDWKLDFDFLARDEHTTYFIEVDSAWPGDASRFDVRLKINAETLAGASAEARFDKFFFDYESGDDSDHYDCAVRARSGFWALLPLGALALLALGRRRLVAG
ncbi:MAG: hypothetical protein HS108_14975 [Planctomycetes bacterium]|jgi:hypothetical protein|nr:hypothetical protein [Planctomycetota bacterium]MCL4729610.1 hypothetical protein [Planctomycetota bacterium]